MRDENAWLDSNSPATDWTDRAADELGRSGMVVLDDDFFASDYPADYNDADGS